MSAPVPGATTFGEVSAGFDVRRLPLGVAHKTLHSPQRGRPYAQAAIPPAKRMKDGSLRTDGTTGFEGVNVVIGPWGQEPVEYATVQVSAKWRDGSNVEPMVGDADLQLALDNVVGPILSRLGYRGRLEDALVQRFDSVLDFRNVEQHGRYVAAFGENRPPIRGGRHVMHADQTLAMHANGLMTRLYDKGVEARGVAEALHRSRFEFERKRATLKKAGVSVVADLALARLDREARTMFEDCGYDREVAPVAEWVWKVMATQPVHPRCDYCAGTLEDGADRLDFDLDLAAELDVWGDAISFRSPVAGCLEPDRCGKPIKGLGPAAKKGAIADALFQRVGLRGAEFEVHRNTRRLYDRLFAAAGVAPADVSLLEEDPDADIVFLDLSSQEERRRPPERRTA